MDTCPFCGADYLITIEPPRYNCGTLKTAKPEVGQSLACKDRQISQLKSKYDQLWKDCGFLNDRNHELLQTLQSYESELADYAETVTKLRQQITDLEKRLEAWREWHKLAVILGVDTICHQKLKDLEEI